MTTRAEPLRQSEPQDPLRERAARLNLVGLVAHWEEHRDTTWLPKLLEQEEAERERRSLERRLREARIGRFKPISDFDWSWPKEIDRDLVDDLFTLGFLSEAVNVVIGGEHGLGKTMIAQNLAYQAVLRGYTARFVRASELLNDLLARPSPAALGARLRQLARPDILVIDEVGYLSYDTRHADLLLEALSRRHLEKSTVITTNRRFQDWNQIFPNAASAVALVDRLVQRAELLWIVGESYRRKEAAEREARCRAERAARRGGKKIRGPAPVK